MKYLITGGCGFIGSNLAKHVLDLKEDLVILDNLSRNGSDKNFEWLKGLGKFKLIKSDITNSRIVDNLIKTEKPDVIFHLAGQVAMTASILDPRRDFEINAIGTINVLEAVRKHCSDTPIFYSSSNKVYGDLEYLTYQEHDLRYTVKEFPRGFDESLKLNFQSPYGCSKGAADQYLLDYHKIYGLNTVVFRHSSMYGGNQHPTFDQGWISWFCKKGIEIKQGTLKEKFTISGTGKQVRDLLYSKDVVSLYFSALKKITLIKGHVFNIGGGYENSLSILELLKLLENQLNVDFSPHVTFIEARQSDQLSFVANNEKITKMTNWTPITIAEDGIIKTLQWLQ